MKTPNPRTRNENLEEGFTLVELMIVMSVMLILMVMIIPNAMKMLRSANQTSAVQTMRAIGSAEVQYSSAYPANGFSCTLAALGGVPGSGAPSATAAQVLDPNLAATGTKSGYTFAISNCTKVQVNGADQITGYQVTAVPNSVGRTGDRGYCMDENNLIKFDPAGGTNCTQSVQ
jgi:type IV pilus assembly protein PilA